MAEDREVTGGTARREEIPAAGAVTHDDPDPQYGNAVDPFGRADPDSMTLVAVYANLEQADRARTELARHGHAVQMVARRGDGPEEGSPPVITGDGWGQHEPEQVPPREEHPMGTGVAVGATLGGTVGLLAATYFIPPLGTMVQAAPLLSTLAGAGLGSFLGGIVEYGAAAKDDAPAAGQVRTGGVILLVRVPKPAADEARAALDRWGALEIRVP